MIAIAAFLSLLQCFHWCCQIEFKSIRLTRLQLLLFYFTIDVLSCHDLLERCKVYCKYLRDFVQVNIIPHVMACLILRFVLLKEFRVIMYLVTGSNLSVIISTWDIMILSGLTTSTKRRVYSNVSPCKRTLKWVLRDTVILWVHGPLNVSCDLIGWGFFIRALRYVLLGCWPIVWTLQMLSLFTNRSSSVLCTICEHSTYIRP